MKSTVDKLEGLARKINVHVPAEKVQQAFDKVYKAIQKKANIKRGTSETIFAVTGRTNKRRSRHVCNETCFNS